MIEPAIALAAAIFGGVGLKVVEAGLNRSKAKVDLETQMRLELRNDVVSLKEELDQIEANLDLWKKKYYKLLVSFNELTVVAVAAGLDSEVAKIRKESGG